MDIEDCALLMEKVYGEVGQVASKMNEELTLEKNLHLLRDQVGHIIEQVLVENPLPFPLLDFQKLALHQIGSLNNVILVSPTGSGKMVVVYLAILVLRKVYEIQDGVGVGCQPLSSIMNEKLGTSYVRCGSISMKGSLRTGGDGEEDEDHMALTDSVDAFKNGEVDCITGHAESWISKVAKEILDSLQRKGLILLVFVDEAHIPLVKHWDSFRPELRRVPGMLRGRAVRGSPLLATTATLTMEEEGELMASFGLRRVNTTVLRASPVLKHHKYIRLERPPNMYGSYGVDVKGIEKPGLIQMLRNCILDKFVEHIEAGIPPKKAIVFFKKEDDIADVNDYLCNALPEVSKDPSSCPWVVNFSGVGPATAKSISDRKEEISLYLTTSVMLMGLDLKDIEIVGMVRPFSTLHSIIQACGRGGRRSSKEMKKVAFFLLFNRYCSFSCI